MTMAYYAADQHSGILRSVPPEKHPMLCPLTHTEPDDRSLVLSPTVTNAPAYSGLLKVVIQKDGLLPVTLSAQLPLREFAQLVTRPYQRRFRHRSEPAA